MMSIPRILAKASPRLRAARDGVALASALGACLALGASPAGAAVIHSPEGRFDASQLPSGSFGLPLALAVDNSSGASAGDVYVGGSTGFGGSSYVYKFSKAGTYLGIELKGSETTQGSYNLLDFANFEGSRGLAVDDSSGANKGDVYLADAEHDVIDRFSEDGTFLCEITGKKYEAVSSAEQQHECAGAAGSQTPDEGFHAGEFTLSGPGVAVDPQNGDVYVSSPADKVIDEFNAAGEYIGQIEGPQLTEPTSLAFNSTGELYVANGGITGGEDVVKLTASGSYLSTLDESGPASVAVNPANGRIFVAESSEGETAEYDATGKLFSTFGKEQSGAVAVSGETGTIYISALFSSSIYMYGKAAVVPNVTTGAASEVKEQTATLHGEVEPDSVHGGGTVTTCQFEYASEYTLHHIQTVHVQVTHAPGTFNLSFDGQSTGWNGEGKLAPESSTVTEVTGLEGFNGVPVPGEEVSGSGIPTGTTVVSYDAAKRELTLSQQTEATVPSTLTGLTAALPAGASSQLLRTALEALSPPHSTIATQRIGSGDVAVAGPAGGPWTVEFTGSLGSFLVPLLELEQSFSVEGGVERDWAAASQATCEPTTPYTEATQVSVTPAGLSPSATYEYRLTASDSEGSATGENKTFETSGPPTIDRQAAESLQTTANLKAHINPRGYDTTCQAQYVSDADFQQSQWADATTLPCQPERLGSGFSDVTAKVKVRGLARATIYHYRFLATNQAGSTDGSGGAFETYGVRDVSVEFLKSASIIPNGGAAVWQAGEQESWQAGAHPYELVTTITFSHTTEFSRCAAGWEQFSQLGCPGEIEIVGSTAVNTKDIKVGLPPGVIGNPTAVPKCNRYLVQQSECPPDTQVGMIEVWVDYPLGRGNQVWPLPDEYETEELTGRRYQTGIYNVEPAGPRPAEFAAFIEGQAPAWIPFEVRSGSDYGITANSIDLTDVGGGISRVRTRVWGVPADPRHEVERRCPEAAQGSCTDTASETPLLSNPTSCEGPLTVTASSDSWQEPGVFTSATTKLPGFTGCNKLKFEPTFEAQPTSSAADSSSGLHVDMHVPQPEGCKEEGGEAKCELAEADLKDAKVVLPPGMVIDPSSADGLEACSEAQMGYLPQQSGEVGRPQFTPDPASCPDGSKIGRVEIDSRLVDHPLVGGVYVAQQSANPFKSLLALYIAVYDASTGLVIKLPGQVTPDPLTGQLTVSFDQDPQLPFEDFKLDLFPGTRATLTTPLTCGSFQAATDLTPWSSPEGADANPLSTPFSLTAGCAPSEAQAPNAPAFEAGTASPIGASYSPFVLHLKREDGSQRFSAIDVTLPPGLTGKIAGLQECPQGSIDRAKARSHAGEGALEQAQASCPTASEVGAVHVGTGSGAPDYVAGHVYFAGPYEGAPFSLVFITPALAGPFDLGTVVVRAGIYVDPNTTQVTVKSDPLPSMLDGIPLDIRSIGVDINRREFMLNPTSCAPMSVSGQEISSTGQSAPLSERFQAGGCTTLPFDPSFKASAGAGAGSKEGASLIVRVGSGSGQANIAKVHVTLPKQLPSRLTTLQKACIDTVFNQNPVNCPAASKVGEATATTPILSTPLTGPAYFVSHGGAKFPELIVVLSGDGVTVDLHGETYIDKSQITTSTFPSLPDLPVSSFELKLPAGPYSALAANGDLCSQKLTMPTQITGQNGALVEQQTPISVEGCKPEMRVLRHRVKGKKAIVVVQVPSAGTLIAGGKGLSHVKKKVGKAGIVTVTLKLSKAEQRFVAHHRGRRLMAPIRLSFKPARGGSMKATVAVLMK